MAREDELRQAFQELSRAATELSAGIARLSELVATTVPEPPTRRPNSPGFVPVPSASRSVQRDPERTRLASSGVCLPQLGERQLRDATHLFRSAATLGLDKLPYTFHQRLGVLHAIFAASSGCDTWSEEWDRIIDEAKGLVDQGAERVKEFVEDQLDKAGFPKWAKDIVTEGIDQLMGLGEAELKVGLEVARAAGKLGLWLRCHWPF